MDGVLKNLVALVPELAIFALFAVTVASRFLRSMDSRDKAFLEAQRAAANALESLHKTQVEAANAIVALRDAVVSLRSLIQDLSRTALKRSKEATEFFEEFSATLKRIEAEIKRTKTN